MPIIDTVFGAKAAYVLGITNLVGLLLIFFSCRCLMGSRLAKRLWQFGWYRKFYSMHCYFWWLFFVSVAMHVVFAFAAYGNPF